MNLKFKLNVNKMKNQIKEIPTTIKKGFDGIWKAKTITTYNNRTYEISTNKRNKELVTSFSEVIVKDEGNFISTKHVNPIFSKNFSVTIFKSSAPRITSNVIAKHHAQAILIFDEKIVEYDKTLPPIQSDDLKIEIKSIIFQINQFESKVNNYIVYKIDEEDNRIFTVEKHTLELRIFLLDEIKPYDEQNNRGSYFDPQNSFKGNDDDLNNLVIDAHKIKQQKKSEDEKLKEIHQKNYEQKIEVGKTIFPNLPIDAKAVIIAEFREDKSDCQTDYFHSSVKKEVYLGISSSTRISFAEMRKFAKVFDETKHLAIKNDKNEHRENYSMGRGYYLTEGDTYSGWQIVKKKIYNQEETLHNIQLAISENRSFIQLNNQPKEKENQETPTLLKDSSFTLIRYSEKSFAIIGDTLNNKDLLIKLNGRFNSRLKCGPGFIFSLKQLDKVCEELNINPDDIQPLT